MLKTKEMMAYHVSQWQDRSEVVTEFLGMLSTVPLGYLNGAVERFEATEKLVRTEIEVLGTNVPNHAASYVHDQRLDNARR